MGCITTSIAATSRDRRGFTLPEFVVALGMASLVALVALTAMSHSSLGFALLTQHADLDRQSRHTLDLLGSEIRQADALVEYATNRIVLRVKDPRTGTPGVITYVHDPAARTLTRSVTGAEDAGSTLLAGCESLRFVLFQRNPVGGAYDQYPLDAGRPDLCKLVQVSWRCSRTGWNGKVTSESVQSAKFVIRKQ